MNKLIGLLISYLKSEFLKVKQIWVGWHIARLKNKADKLRETEGTQMFVVKLNGKIRIISKRWFKEQRQKGIFPKNFTTENLKRISFYYTRG